MAVSPGRWTCLLEAGWIRLRGRRRTPGRPVTFGTTPAFLDHFGLESIGDLPGLADLRAAGLIETLASPGDETPTPDDSPELRDDEDPLELDFAGLDAEEDAAAEADEDETAGETNPTTRPGLTGLDDGSVFRRRGKSFWRNDLPLCATPSHKSFAWLQPQMP